MTAGLGWVTTLELMHSGAALSAARLGLSLRGRVVSAAASSRSAGSDDSFSSKHVV